MEFKDIVSKAKIIRAKYDNTGLYQFLLTNNFEISDYNYAFEDWQDEGNRYYKDIPEDLSEDEVKELFEKSNVMYNINFEENYDNSIYITINFTPIYKYNPTTKLLELIDFDMTECDMSDYDWNIENNSNDKVVMSNFMNSCDDLKKFFAKYISLLDNLEKYGIKCWR